jgi:hypothetical protein
MLGAEVVLLVIGGVALALLMPMLSALWATVAARSAACSSCFNLGLVEAAWCCRSPLDPDDGITIYVMNMGVRLFRRVALQAPACRAVRRVRAAGAGRAHGARPAQVQHGAEERRS